MINDRYELGEVLAVQWCPDMAARFPKAHHHSCRQEMQYGRVVLRPFAEPYRELVPFDPPRCVDWHCNRCGKPTNSMGHHNTPCPDRPQQ